MRFALPVWLLAACFFFLTGNSPALAQDEDLVIFDDNFNDDPALNDWILLYSGTAGGWVPPESIYCEAAPGNPDPAAFIADMPCTLYSEEIIEDQLEMDLEEFGGYVLVTPPQNSSAGAVFRSERALYDNVKMEITVELRDGAIGRPADGMTVVVLGAEDPPMQPGGGGKIARSAGSSVQLVAKEGDHATLRLPSTEMRRVRIDCRATIGEVGNQEHELTKIGKAGRNRWKGVRPQSRGVVMNPVDHPLGGGEGKSSGGRHPVSPWGKPEGRTRKRGKQSDKLIVRRRRRRGSRR